MISRLKPCLISLDRGGHEHYWCDINNSQRADRLISNPPLYGEPLVMEPIKGQALIARLAELKNQGKTEQQVALELGWSKERKNAKGVLQTFALVAAMRQEIVKETWGFESKPAPKARENKLKVQANGNIIVSSAYTGAKRKDPTGTMKWSSGNEIRVELDTANDRIILKREKD